MIKKNFYRKFYIQRITIFSLGFIVGIITIWPGIISGTSRKCFYRKDISTGFKGDRFSITQGSNLLYLAWDNYDGEVKISNIKSKIKFELNNSILISKLIDGKFPNYIQVIPKNNQKKLEIDLKLFLGSVDRVASVSLDKKDGVKFSLSKDALNLSVNNTNSGDGN